MFPETTTVSEEYDIDYNGPGENVEVDDIAATTAGIATVTRIISRKRPSKEGSTPIDEDSSEKATCPIGESIGECISNQCPEGHTCFNNECCFLENNDGYSSSKIPAFVQTGTEMENCRDRRSDCYEWSQEGFCESALYTTKQKLKFCGKSCNLC
uniref:ShKT domain-containing protein n=1 Tax=Heterorhabditis bacteriophora TaxID=37862 RepID=A0A1I7WZ00_HETBA